MAKIVVPLFHIMVFFRTQKTGQFLSLVLDFIKFTDLPTCFNLKKFFCLFSEEYLLHFAYFTSKMLILHSGKRCLHFYN